MLIRILVFAALMCSYVGTASADFVIRCGGSNGYAYFLEGGSVLEGQGGWQKDAISNGQIIFVSKGQNSQILIGDVAGMRDVESDGGNLTVTHADTHMTTAVVVYPAGAVETYGFRLRPDHSEVVWG